MEKKSRSSFEIYAPMASHFASVRKFFKQNSILRPPQLTLSLRKSSSTRSNHSTSPHPPHRTPSHSTPREGGCCGPVGLIKSRFTLILIHAKPFLPFVFSLIYAANTERQSGRERGGVRREAKVGAGAEISCSLGAPLSASGVSCHANSPSSDK